MGIRGAPAALLPPLALMCRKLPALKGSDTVRFGDDELGGSRRSFHGVETDASGGDDVSGMRLWDKVGCDFGSSEASDKIICPFPKRNKTLDRV